MKPSTLNTLLVAKSIYGETKYLVNSGDKHMCTAGIILLQDFVELVVLAVLDELDVDEQRALESKSFDELLGELKKRNVPVIKSGSIKALNKQRVISKHYGQLAEPASVVNYFSIAIKFTDTLFEAIIGAKLNEIFLTDILKDGEPKELVKESIALSEQEKYLPALIGLRKAFFIAYEFEYCIYRFRERDQNEDVSFGLLYWASGGMKTYYWTRNKQWISKNVTKPVDYVQINHDQLKTDCMELGVSTVDIENFRRLTPNAVRTEKDAWHFEYSPTFVANELNRENFNYCLDIIIDFLLKKQEFDSSRRFPKREKSIPAPPIYIGKPLFRKPSQYSEQIGVVEDNYYYDVDNIVSGFDSSEKYLYVHLFPQEEKSFLDGHIWGYLLVEEG
ncbi:hypothetical protein [Methylomonas albis]|uniref:Uncharacterized protein n=1 Tax=Methylomonas albis TaxID=1854563 RepID=A0ABR9D1G7_9GAMM|nr:hypothetical protein [Methylomonas albis]MBD9356971.1 hypothetical protein [Methylomonas albis]CAD6880161.1 hypothetical protein [Methylomonas albis]